MRKASKTKRDLAIITAALLLSLEQAARALQAGDITAAQFTAAVNAMLVQSHLSAARLGVQLANSQVAPGASKAATKAANRSAASKATAAAVSEGAFVVGLAAAIAAGRYVQADADAALSKALQARLALYANRVVGTANAAWLGVLKDLDIEVRWVVSDDERTCPDCLYEDSLGWRAASTLTRVPGDGRTKCLSNCRCKLVTADGASFRVP